MSRTEENKCEGQDVAYLAFWGLGFLRGVESQLTSMMEVQQRVGCATKSCACEWVLCDGCCILHHEAALVVYLLLMLAEASLPYCSIQRKPDALNRFT